LINKDNSFYKEYNVSIKALDDPDITEQEIIYNEIYTTGAYAVFRVMRKFMIKKYWKDTAGYPLMEKFYSKNLLVCSISIRKLTKATNFGNQKIQKLLIQLENAGWILTADTKVKDGQKVYVLGYWSTIDNKYKPTLYSHEIINIPTKVKSKFEGIYNDYDRMV